MTLTPPAYECPTVHPCDTMRHDNGLVPYPEKVKANFKVWLAQQESLPSPPGRGVGGEGEPPAVGAGRRFTNEQRWWLEKMAEHVASNLELEADDFGYAPFDQRGGLGKVHQLFGAELPMVMDELSRELVA